MASARGREGGRESGAGPPERLSVYERGGSAFQLGPRCYPPIRRAPAWGLGAGSSVKRARGAGRRGRGALRCRPVLTGCCGPRARGAPRRAHYAGGLPAAAMASRAPLRAARSPQGPGGPAAPAATGRAALPSAGCCPLPPGRNSSSRPRLLLLLLLLLQDAGGQQGEWWPAPVGLLRLLAVGGTCRRTQRCRDTTLARLMWRGPGRGGGAARCFKFVSLYFSAKPFISVKEGRMRPCRGGLLAVSFWTDGQSREQIKKHLELIKDRQGLLFLGIAPRF